VLDKKKILNKKNRSVNKIIPENWVATLHSFAYTPSSPSSTVPPNSRPLSNSRNHCFQGLIWCCKGSCFLLSYFSFSYLLNMCEFGLHLKFWGFTSFFYAHSFFTPGFACSRCHSLLFYVECLLIWKLLFWNLYWNTQIIVLKYNSLESDIS